MYQSGRLQCFKLHGRQGEGCIIYNHYAPSGESKKYDRTLHYQGIHQELASRGPMPIIVAGDWNEPIDSSAMIARLCVGGWTLPRLTMKNRQDERATYHLGQTRQWLDGFVLSPQVCRKVAEQEAQQWPHIHHSAVTIPFELAPKDTFPTMTHPPKLVSRHLREEEERVEPSKHEGEEQQDWAKTRRIILSIQNPSCLADQDCIDASWGIFEDAFRDWCKRHFRVEGPGDIQQIGRLQLGSEKKRRGVVGKHGPRTQAEIESTRAYHRLWSLANNQGNATLIRRKVWEKKATLRATLGLSETQISQALDNPHHFLGEWEKRLRNHRVRERRKGVRAWQKTLCRIREDLPRGSSDGLKARLPCLP